MRPVNGFAGARDDNHRAFGFGAIGRFPQGQKGVGACLQLLLFLSRDLSLKCRRFFLTTLRQRLTFEWFFFGVLFLRDGRRVGRLDGKSARQDQRQAQCWQCQAVDRGHRIFQARSDSGSLMGWSVFVSV
ncbi:hypothetical protein D3C85_1019750 [compost metagenome]